MSDTPPHGTRGAHWYQGACLPAAALAHLCGASLDPREFVAVVVTHDCDLTNDPAVEPDVELILGRRVDSLNGAHGAGKDARTLHLPASHRGESIVIALRQPDKQRITKDDLWRYQPDSDFTLSASALSTLRDWLARRYNRPAFPDEFVNRLKAGKVDTKLAALFKVRHPVFQIVLFDVDGGRHLRREDGDPYELAIVLVTTVDGDPDEVAQTADETVEAIERLFASRLDQERSIKLTKCLWVTEARLSVAQARAMKAWSLEYLTARDELRPSG